MAGDKNDGQRLDGISGRGDASYTVEKVTAEQNGWKYRCVIKNAAGSVESNAATLTVKEAIGDVKKNDDTKDTTASGGLGRILLITGIIVAVLALGAGSVLLLPPPQRLPLHGGRYRLEKVIRK